MRDIYQHRDRIYQHRDTDIPARHAMIRDLGRHGDAGDIALLVNYFVNNLKTIYGRPDLRVSPSALKWLKNLPLPGNIRQLKNGVVRGNGIRAAKLRCPEFFWKEDCRFQKRKLRLSVLTIRCADAIANFAQIGGKETIWLGLIEILAEKRIQR